MVIDIDHVLASDDLVGVLTRDVAVRLVDISVSGCLVESASRLEAGASCDLRIRIGSDVYTDAVRISRVQQVQGAGSTWKVGAEFLWTSQPGPRSLRRVVTRLRQALIQQTVDVEFASRPM